jgi:hypothetical protein
MMYIEFIKRSTDRRSERKHLDLCSVFDRAVAAVGTDTHAAPLYTENIAFVRSWSEKNTKETADKVSAAMLVQQWHCSTVVR